MANQPATPQMNVRVDRETRAKVIAIAAVRGERDDMGSGASVVVRRALAAYIDEHGDQLPDWWRDRL